VTEVIVSLVGAIVGSAITLVYTNWSEKLARKREEKILRKTLLEESQLHIKVLEVLGSQYAKPKAVHPMRVSLDLFVHALNRHVGEIGDVGLIRLLSQVVLNVRALNTALDRYEPELMKALDDSRRLQNVEHSRKGICRNIQLCQCAINELKAKLES